MGQVQVRWQRDIETTIRTGTGGEAQQFTFSSHARLGSENSTWLLLVHNSAWTKKPLSRWSSGRVQRFKVS